MDKRDEKKYRNVCEKLGLFPKMTTKMKLMYEDIMTALYDCIDEEHIYFLFGQMPLVSIDAFGEYVMLEFIKYSYDETAEKHPLRYYIPYDAMDDDHSERMRYSRALKYTQSYRDKNYNALGEQYGWDEEKMKEYSELKSKDMSVMKERFEGYEISEMVFFEHTTIQDLRIIKSLVENRLYNSKKVSNEAFIEMFEEYDNWVRNLIERSKESDEDMVFASLAYYTLEWKYSFELIYMIAEKMVEDDIDDVSFWNFYVLCGFLRFHSRLGIDISMDSRMIKERQRVLDLLIFQGEPDPMDLSIRDKYAEIVGVMGLLFNITCTEGGTYADWFKDNTDIHDWASFFREYNVFDTWHEKKWTNKKIKKARKILEMRAPYGKYSKNPDFRA